MFTMMQKTAKLKQFGDKEWKNAILNLPDIAQCISKFDIDIIEYPDHSTGMIYFTEKDNDTHSIRYNLKDPNGIKNSIKTIIDLLTSS